MTQSNDATDADTDFKSLLEPVLEPAYRTAYHLTRNEADIIASGRRSEGFR